MGSEMCIRDRAKGIINYTVWSDVFACPECGGEMIFWDVAVDKEVGKVRPTFACPHCSVEHSKRAPPCDLCNEMCGKSCVDGLAQTFQSLPPIVIQTVPKHRHVRKLQVFFPWSSQLVAWS